MRCKNCGTENDDNRYICENCGSPLYDEEDFNDAPSNKKSVGEDEVLDLGITPDTVEDDGKASGTEKKSVIVIAILAVVLIAIIASVIVVAQSKSSSKETTSETFISTTLSTTEKKQTTAKETTTQTTTAATTTTTTETTTAKPEEWSIKLISKGGGTVKGSGTYKDGDNVTIVATPDSGYEFDGWYSNGIKISSTTRYSFTATENVSISAVFNPVVTTPDDTDNESLEGGLE